MPSVLTMLRVEVDAAHAAGARALVADADGAVGAPEEVARPDDGTLMLVMAFHLASDAAATSLHLAATVAGGPGARVALSTGEVDLVDGTLRGPARDRVDGLAGRPGDARILLTASTAVMVTSTLPAGAEIVDLGVVRLAGRDERTYELRPGRADARSDDDVGTSNLGWARRAAARLVVGRDEPLDRLEKLWTGALAGEHRVVVVSGDPGIGKTTLAAEMALRVHAGRGTVLYGRWDEEGLTPYQALREALGTYASACPRRLLRRDIAAHADELARLLPDLGAHVGGVRAPLVDDPDAERQRFFDAVRDWLGAIARRRPVMLVLDDLQWAERSSLLLLRHLLDSPPAGPVLTVVTLRDGEVEGMGPLHTLGSFEDRSDVERIEVPGLRRADVGELLVRAVGREALAGGASDAAAWLTDETAGNPLFVHEILRGLDDGDPVAALARARDHLPERVHDVVRWRLSGLPDETGDSLAVASFLGEEFSLDVLAATLGVRVLDLRHRLDDAVRVGLVRDADDGGHLAFAHAVVRRALQDDVPAARAVEVHRRIGSALAERDDGPGSATLIAHHYLLAAGPDTAVEAVRWGRAAADQARRETAFEGVVSFLDRAVAVHDRYGGLDSATGIELERARELACDLRLDLADAHDRAGEFVARDRRHLEAAELARSLDRTDLFVRAALGFGGRLPASPPPNPAARHLLGEALDRLSPQDSRARALSLARLAHVIHADAPHSDRKAVADEAEEMARRLDAPVVLASVLGSRVLALDGPDDVDEHLDIGAEVIRIGEQTGDPDLVLQGARARIHPLFVVAAHDAARDLADTFTQLAGTVRHPDHLRLAAMWQTMWIALEGRFDEATAQADQLRRRLEVAGHSQVTSINFMQTFVIRWLRGRAGDARPVVAAGRGQYPASLTWWALMAWIDAAEGRVEEAEAVLHSRAVADLADEDAGYLWMLTMVATGTAAALVGDRVWAQAAHDALAPYSGRNCVLGYAAYLGAMDHHLGVLELTLGDCDAAVASLDAALERHRVIGAHPWEALSAAWLARALADRGARDDLARAIGLDGAARARAEDLGVAVLPPPDPRLSG